MNKEKVSCVVPAYNEAKSIGGVLTVLSQSRKLNEIIVVNDGSKDMTSDVVKKFPRVILIELPQNQGKSNALLAGAKAAGNPLLFFCDADLTGFNESHIDQLLSLVTEGGYKMVCGAQEFMDVTKKTKLEDKNDILSQTLLAIGGEKVLYKNDFFKIPDLLNSDYGVEQRILRYYEKNKLPYKLVVLKGVGHVHKMKKWGFWEGLVRDVKSYGEFISERIKDGIKSGPAGN